MRLLVTTEPAIAEPPTAIMDSRSVNPLPDKSHAPATSIDRASNTEWEHRRDERPSRLDQFDRDAELKRALRTLQIQNGQLKRLVVQLSETLVRNVVGIGGKQGDKVRNGS